ncbi:hypothetical protein [Staphylococcus pettenkoferi]|uniref:hypothetical protein n=1 Tax=Staphylococcus pettenkoferi TaxID=170573 RepID=UPI00164341BF|nr:hypothetical protein [Staphylococcus pettenkoferi]
MGKEVVVGVVVGEEEDNYIVGEEVEVEKNVKKKKLVGIRKKEVRGKLVKVIWKMK